ncbi:MAG: carboxypeptidase regulatory-like domain-containing protein [Flavobacteriales bacterium]|nr:carboxypeptidase regulatory-like domain-containing protein [Flavobacteriales bacterium]
MKPLKLFFLAVIGVLSLGAVAQNYEVKGVVIDSKGYGVVGATIRTNKSKVSVMTTDGGVFSLRATPKDTELRLIMNKYTVMEKDLSASIATNPIAFELDETNDPAITGYKNGDTYYPGENDSSMEEMIKKQFPGYSYVDRYIGKYAGAFGAFSPIKSYMINGSMENMITITDPTQIYSIKILKDGTAYGSKYGMVEIITKEYHNAGIKQEKAVFSPNKDTIRGRVTDGWGRPAPDLKITTPSGETTVTNDSGYYAIRVTKKDKFLRCIMPYTEGTTVRISKENWKKPINLTVMLRKNDFRGWFSEDMTTYYLGEENGDWSVVINMFSGTFYANRRVYFRRYQTKTIQDIDPSAWIGRSKESLPTNGCPALLVVDGVPMKEGTLDAIETHSIHSIKMIKDHAEQLYGSDAQFGAVELVTKGMNNVAPVALTDFAANKAKREGNMKKYIATQGKNLEYDDAGYILVNGKRCGLYIINDKEFNHMRGIEVGMIDDIIILNDDYTASYGPRAKNGVVLISASQKEKRVVDEKGNTVSEKEYKKQQKKNKK